MSVSYSYEDKFDELTSCPLNRPHMTILVKFENGAPFRKYFLKLLFWKKIVCTAYSGLCLGRKTTHSAYTSSAQINQSILLSTSPFPPPAAGHARDERPFPKHIEGSRRPLAGEGRSSRAGTYRICLPSPVRKRCHPCLLTSLSGS
jgi:hypothetical protein